MGGSPSRQVWLGVADLVAAAVATLGATWLGWWAGGGDAWSVVPGVLLGGFVGCVTFGLVVRLLLLQLDLGSVRQAERALREAEKDAWRLDVVSARLVLRLLRWKRR